MALFPLPSPGTTGAADAVADLDERALLLWWTTGGLQVHALVRHVVLETMGEAAIQRVPEPALTIGPPAPAPSLR